MPIHTILAIAAAPHGAVHDTQPDPAYVECDPPQPSMPSARARQRSIARRSADGRLGVRKLSSALAAT
jgi:hypothetical protein